MNPLLELMTGILISIAFILVIKYFFNRFDADRKYTLGMDLKDFSTALDQNNIKEINRLGVRLLGNPYLTLEQLEMILQGFDKYKKHFLTHPKDFKKFESAIVTKRINWGLFAHRYSDPEQYEAAKRNPLNVPED